MHVVFSIPVHEKPFVIVDQVVNFRNFNPDCGIVLHVSPSLSDYDFEQLISLLNKFPRVFLNPHRLRTGFSDIIQAHISNFQYVEHLRINYEYFCLSASNELFVKSGLYNFIKRYKAGLQMKNINFSKEISISYRAQQDEALLSAIKEAGGNGVDDIVNSQVEGAFFQREIFKKIAGYIDRNFCYENINILYPREEIYFSSLLHLILHNGDVYKDNYTFFNKNSPIIAVHLEDILKIVEENGSKFSVKRIIRNYNDPIRFYIRNFVGRYEHICESIGLNQKEYTMCEIQKHDAHIKCFEAKEKVKRVIINTLRRIKFIRNTIDKNKYLLSD